MMNAKVLILNSSYEPLNVSTMKKAIIMIVKGSAIVEETSDYQIGTVSTRFDAPSVVRLARFIKIPAKKVALSRKNIILRDRYKCQYCGKTFNFEDLTMDHIIPKSKGGKDDWTNVVASCFDCNNKKADHMPQDIGMMPMKKAAQPSRFYMQAIIASNEDADSWKKYLFQ